MAFDPMSLALLGGGASLLGGILGGSSASKQAKAEQAAAAQTRQDSIDNSVFTNYAQLAALFGNDAEARNYLTRLLPRNLQDEYLGVAPTSASFTPQEQARLAQIDQEIAQANRGNSGGVYGWGNSNRAGQNASTRSNIQALEAEKAALMAKSGGNPGKLGKINASASFGSGGSGGGLLAEYTGLADQAKAGTGRLLGSFDADTAKLDAGYADMIGQANQWGRGREQQIRQDATDQEKRLNQQAVAAMAARGVGGTNLMGSLTGNSRAVNKDMQNSLMNLGESKLDRVLNLGSQRQGALGQRLNTRAGIMGSGEDQFLALSRLPLDLKSSVLLNPGAPQLTQASSASPSGAFGSVIANSLGSMGGLFGGLGLQQLLTQQNQNNRRVA